jgi:hypothetical protein
MAMASGRTMSGGKSSAVMTRFSRWIKEDPFMRDDPDLRAIDVCDERDVEAWCRQLGTNEQDLWFAVDAVGVRVRDVRKYLLELAARRAQQESQLS